jgi:hypothetical protein
MDKAVKEMMRRLSNKEVMIWVDVRGVETKERLGEEDCDGNKRDLGW